MAHGQRQPTAGAPAQLCALRSVLCPPPGPPASERGSVLSSPQPISWFPGVGTQLRGAKLGPGEGGEGEGSDDSHTAGFLMPTVWLSLGTAPGKTPKPRCAL